MKCIYKHQWHDGNIMLTFEPATTLNEAKGPPGHSGPGFYGSLHVLVSAACAADFTVGNNYTWTAT